MNIQKLFDLSGKCAVIVGGAGKIGLPLTEALGEAGASVVIASRNKHEETLETFKNKGIKIHFVEMDQADEGMVLQGLDCVSRHIKTPDILINCGVERPMQGFFEDSFEKWDLSMRANARGLFLTCRAFAKSMAATGGGSIINVASIYGLVAPDPALYEGTNIETEPDYPYTKGGMIMFSKYLAARFAKNNVRVNVIAPGGFYNNQPEPFLSQYCKKVPLGRMAVHDDLKGVAVFLASPASSYITGAVIPVDGGFSVI